MSKFSSRFHRQKVIQLRAESVRNFRTYKTNLPAVWFLFSVVATRSNNALLARRRRNFFRSSIRSTRGPKYLYLSRGSISNRPARRRRASNIAIFYICNLILKYICFWLKYKWFQDTPPPPGGVWDKGLYTLMQKIICT